VADEQHDPPGAVAAGTQITQFREERGRREETRYLISGWEPSRSLTLQSVGARPASTIRYGLEDVTAWTREVDTVMFCVSKGLGAPVGSLLAGPADVMAEARANRERLELIAV